MPGGYGTHADSGALGSNEGRDAVDRFARCGVARTRRTAPIIAVKAQAGVDVRLCAEPRTEHCPAFRTHDSGAVDAAVGWIACVDPKAVAVYTKPSWQ